VKSVLKQKGLKKGSIATSSCTTTSGSITGGIIQYAYDNELVFIFIRLTLQNVAANTRPTITVPLPTDMPSFDAYGALTIRGPAGSTIVSDNAVFSHAKGNSYGSGWFNNFIGNAPAGYLTFLIPGSVPF